MKLKIIDFIFGTCVMKACGTFAERIINIAKEKGIFIQNITRTDEKTIIFTVSRKGSLLLLDLPLPEDLSLTVIKSRGLPYVFSRGKNRIFLLLTPIVTFVMLFLSTQVIWHVNVIDAQGEKEEHILNELAKLGVKRGALKFTINQSDVKNSMLISNPELLWIWVDIRGSSAIVKYADRIMIPEVLSEDDYYNIYSTHDAIITKIIPTNGIAKVSVGDTVLKGEILIEGSIAADGENKKPVHATGEVWGKVWEEERVTIPLKKEIRTPTGNKTEQLSIIFEKFQLKLFINSSILYQSYDIIENNRVIAPFGVVFNKKEYVEVDVKYEDNDIALLQSNYENDFYARLSAQGYTIDYTESYITQQDGYVTLTMGAMVDEPIAHERRMQFGENNSGTDN